MLLASQELASARIEEFTEVSHEPWPTAASCTPNITIAVVYGFHVAVAGIVRASFRITIIKAARLESQHNFT
jgi:hypothetical protein